MNLLISTVSIIVLILEGAELMKSSSPSLLMVAGCVGLLYVIIHLSIKALNDESTSTRSSEPSRPEPTRTTELVSLKVPILKPSVPYKTYAHSQSADKPRISWKVSYWLPNGGKLSFCVLASRDVRDPDSFSSKDEVGHRAIVRAVKRGGGYTPKNAFASIFVPTDENGKKVDIPEEYLHVFVQDGTVDVAVNKLINNFNQYIGKEPFWAFPY